MTALEKFVQACEEWADSESARTGATQRLADLVVSDSLGYFGRAGRELAAETPSIDPQSDIKHHTGLSFSAACSHAALVLRERFPASQSNEALPPGAAPV